MSKLIRLTSSITFWILIITSFMKNRPLKENYLSVIHYAIKMFNSTYRQFNFELNCNLFLYKHTQK